LLCQECEKRTATVHLTKIINGEKEVFHLCEQCAGEKGDFGFTAPTPFSIQNLLTGLLSMEPALGQTPGFQVKVQCENCGLTYAQFGQIGRFGCSSCYSTFKDRLLPVFRRIHGSAQHVGKVPHRTGGIIKVRRDIDVLRRDLQACITREEFEEAARIRDEIRKLETSLDNEGGKSNA
jgi:protein arginine kinase activator